MGYQDLFLALLPGSIALFSESLGIYICSALDSPSVMSKLATPKPATAINSDMSHVIDDATSTLMILMMKLLLCLILPCH